MTGHSAKADVVGRDDSDDLSINVVFDLLANQRRRVVLACLEDNTQSIALTELAEEVAVRENEEPLTEIPKETVPTIATSLYHIHLPKLADAGAVEYDQDRDLVRISKITDQVEQVLSLATDGENER